MPDEVLDQVASAGAPAPVWADIDIQIATAKKYPRPPVGAIREKILAYATLDDETAANCFYTLKRKDASGDQKLIQGPSVRLAEIAFACYGNLRGGARPISNDGQKVTSQALCFDLETNNCVFWEAARRITNKDGRPYSPDMQINTANAASSIAFRNAVFKVIPAVLIKPVYEACMKKAAGELAELEHKRQKVFARFAELGVPPGKLLAWIEKETMDAVDLNDVTALIGLGTALRDGDITLGEILREAAAPAEEEKQSFKERILSRKKPKAEKQDR